MVCIRAETRRCDSRGRQYGVSQSDGKCHVLQTRSLTSQPSQFSLAHSSKNLGPHLRSRKFLSEKLPYQFVQVVVTGPLAQRLPRTDLLLVSGAGIPSQGFISNARVHVVSAASGVDTTVLMELFFEEVTVASRAFQV